MAGGDVLQAQTLIQLLDTRHDSKGSAKRLMKSLVDGGSQRPASASHCTRAANVHL